MKFYTTNELIEQYKNAIDNNEDKISELYQKYYDELIHKKYVEVENHYPPYMFSSSWLFKQIQPQTKEDFDAGINVDEHLDKFLKGEALDRLLEDIEEYQPRKISIQNDNGINTLVIRRNLLPEEDTTEFLNNNVNILIDEEYDFEQIFVSLFEHHIKVNPSDVRFISFDSINTIHYFAKDERDTDDQSPYKFEKGSILTLKLISHRSEGSIYPIVVAHITNDSYTGIVPFDNLLQNSNVYHKVKKYNPSLFLTKDTKVLEEYFD